MIFLVQVVLALAATADPHYLPGFDLGEGFDRYCLFRFYPDKENIEMFWRSDHFLMRCRASPTKGFIAVIGDKEQDRSLYILRENGKLVHEMRDANSRYSWSPDGTRLIYCVENGGRPTGDVCILDLKSGQKEKLPFNAYDVHWSRKTSHVFVRLEDKIATWNPSTGEIQGTSLPSVDLSPLEKLCLNDCDTFFEVYRVDSYQSVVKIASINAHLSHIPEWLNSTIIKTYQTHQDSVFNSFWLVYDCKTQSLYESKENIVAADEANSLLLIKEGKILWRKLNELTKVPLDRLKIVLVSEDKKEEQAAQPNAK